MDPLTEAARVLLVIGMAVLAKWLIFDSEDW